MYILSRYITTRQLLKALAIAAASFNAFILWILFTKPRSFLRVCKVMAMAAFEESGSDPLPSVPIPAILQSKSGQEVWLNLSLTLSVSCLEMLLICGLVRERKPKRILEIGTYRGVTAYHMARNSDADCTIFTLDLPPDYDPVSERKQSLEAGYGEMKMHLLSRQLGREAFRGSDVEHKVTQVYSDSTKLNFNSEFQEGFDFILVDASHDYSHVRSDSLNAFRILNPGGLILWHDYESGFEIQYGVRKCLLELRSNYDIKRVADTNLAIYDAGPKQSVIQATSARQTTTEPPRC
jgi:predicted O-methyltransferase YrrM